MPPRHRPAKGAPCTAPRLSLLPSLLPFLCNSCKFSHYVQTGRFANRVRTYYYICSDPSCFPRSATGEQGWRAADVPVALVRCHACNHPVAPTFSLGTTVTSHVLTALPLSEHAWCTPHALQWSWPAVAASPCPPCALATLCWQWIQRQATPSTGEGCQIQTCSLPEQEGTRSCSMISHKLSCVCTLQGEVNEAARTRLAPFPDQISIHRAPVTATHPCQPSLLSSSLLQPSVRDAAPQPRPAHGIPAGVGCRLRLPSRTCRNTAPEYAAACMPADLPTWPPA